MLFIRKIPIEIQYVDTPRQLEALCRVIQNSPYLALDTEFFRQRTYYPQLCLIQVATDDVVACVDPQALDGLGDFLDIIYQPEVVKIFHSAYQDLEIFYNLRQELPPNVLDTQIVAEHLGYRKHMGYGNLVDEVLGVTLDKSLSRTDWRERPLSEAQIQYAADDVIYLLALHKKFEASSSDITNRPAMEQKLSQLSEAAPYRDAPTLAWKKIKALKKISGFELSAAKALAQWREHTAQERDYPKSWVLSDAELIQISVNLPGSLSDLSNVRGLKVGTHKRYGRQIMEVIESALSN